MNSSACELHIWPTENYIGVNTGVLSGFGIIGTLADRGAHKNRVASVKEYMREYLGPDVQMDDLRKANVAATLGLAGYRIVVEAPMPSKEDMKKGPAVKALAKAMDAKLKSGQRLSTSTAPCYAELVGTNIFYHKAVRSKIRWKTFRPRRRIKWMQPKQKSVMRMRRILLNMYRRR